MVDASAAIGKDTVGTVPAIPAESTGQSIAGIDIDNIWLAENIDIPMVFGLIRPRIYLLVSMESEDLSYVIAHEKMHVDWQEIYYERYYAIWDSEEMMLSEIDNRSIYRDKCSFYGDAIYYIQGGGGGYMMKTDISYPVTTILEEY